MQLGNTKIHYRIDELFRALQKSSPLSLFACTLPNPLGNTHIVLLENGGRFDVMTWFGGSITDTIVDPISSLERFVAPFGRQCRLAPHDAYVISAKTRDFVVSYEPYRGEFMFSTSIALVGVDARAYVLESSMLNGIIFTQVFSEYAELLREFIDFIYAVHGNDVEQVMGLRVSREDASQNAHEPEILALPDKTAESGKILQFIRPAK